jgi:hypothetical protein
MPRHITSKWLLGVAFVVIVAAAAAHSGASEQQAASAPETPSPESEVAAGAPAAFALPWYSVNGGGTLNAASPSYRASQSVGQSVAGRAQSPNYTLGIGFWYGVGAGGSCPIAISGDVNVNGTVTSADIIYLVNHIFKGGAAPLPCPASGDVNCSGALTSADIISLVNYVFKGGAPPCNTCTSSLAAGC